MHDLTFLEFKGSNMKYFLYSCPQLHPREEVVTIIHISQSPSKAGRKTSSFYFYFKKTFFFCLFRAAPMAHGSSHAAGWIGAAAAGLYHSHTKTRSEPCICDLHHSSRQHHILNPLSEARGRKCILLDTSWALNLLSPNRNSQMVYFISVFLQHHFGWGGW